MQILKLVESWTPLMRENFIRDFGISGTTKPERTELAKKYGMQNFDQAYEARKYCLKFIHAEGNAIKPEKKPGAVKGSPVETTEKPKRNQDEEVKSTLRNKPEWIRKILLNKTVKDKDAFGRTFTSYCQSHDMIPMSLKLLKTMQSIQTHFPAYKRAAVQIWSEEQPKIFGITRTSPFVPTTTGQAKLPAVAERLSDEDINRIAAAILRHDNVGRITGALLQLLDKDRK